MGKYDKVARTPEGAPEYIMNAFDGYYYLTFANVMEQASGRWIIIGAYDNTNYGNAVENQTELDSGQVLLLSEGHMGSTTGGGRWPEGNVKRRCGEIYNNENGLKKYATIVQQHLLTYYNVFTGGSPAYQTCSEYTDDYIFVPAGMGENFDVQTYLKTSALRATDGWEWWLRSCSTSTTPSLWRVNSSGGLYENLCNGSPACYVRPAFVFAFNLPTPKNLEWVKGEAHWSLSSSIGGITPTYSVQLYRNGEVLGDAVSVGENETSFDFTQTIRDGGAGHEYTFTVQATSSDQSICPDSTVSDHSPATRFNNISTTFTEGQVSSCTISVEDGTDNTNSALAINGETITVTANIVAGYGLTKWEITGGEYEIVEGCTIYNPTIKVVVKNGNLTFQAITTDHYTLTFEVTYFSGNGTSISFNYKMGEPGEQGAIDKTETFEDTGTRVIDPPFPISSIIGDLSITISVEGYAGVDSVIVKIDDEVYCNNRYGTGYGFPSTVTFSIPQEKLRGNIHIYASSNSGGPVQKSPPSNNIFL